jgi:hypothetical protein
MPFQCKNQFISEIAYLRQQKINTNTNWIFYAKPPEKMLCEAV